MRPSSLVVLAVALAGCAVPLPSGIDYVADGRVVSAADGVPVAGAEVRIVGVRIGRPRSTGPVTCADLARADAALPDDDAGTRVLDADTTDAEGRYAVAIARRWALERTATDLYGAAEYDWWRLEIRREGFAPARAVVTDRCPGSDDPPEVIALEPGS